MNLVAGLKRRLAHIPAFDRWLARREDAQRFEAAIGHLSRGKSLLMYLDAAREPEDFLALSKKLLGPHPAETEICGFLAFAAQHGPSQRVLEIGTAEGATNFLLAHALPGVRLVLGLDLRVKNQPILRFFRQAAQRFEYLDGASGAPETVERVRSILAGQLLDVLFLGGDRHPGSAAADFPLYRSFVRPGGLVAFQDIRPASDAQPGPSCRRPSGDVPRLWQELKPHFQTREFVQDPDGHGIGVLIHDPAIPVPLAPRG